MLAVGNDEIRQNGMGVATATYYTHNTDSRTARLSISEIKDVAVVVAVDLAVTLTSTAGTGLQFRAEGSYVTLVLIF